MKQFRIVFTSPYLLQQQVPQTVGSIASSFNLNYSLLSIKLSSSCLCLLPHLPTTSDPHLCDFFSVALRPNAGHGLLILDVSRSHTTTQHIRYDYSGRVMSSSQRPLPDNTKQSQQTNIHAPDGIRTHDISRRADVDLRLRPRAHWDRLPSVNNISKWT